MRFTFTTPKNAANPIAHWRRVSRQCGEQSGLESYFEEFGETISDVDEPLTRGPLESSFCIVRLFYPFRQSSSKDDSTLAFLDSEKMGQVAFGRSSRSEMKRETIEATRT